jgi:hypothetical protein
MINSVQIWRLYGCANLLNTFYDDCFTHDCVFWSWICNIYNLVIMGWSPWVLAQGTISLYWTQKVHTLTQKTQPVACILGLEGLNSIIHGIKYGLANSGWRAYVFSPRCLCVEASKLFCVPWISFIFAGLLVLQLICSAGDYFCDDIRS